MASSRQGREAARLPEVQKSTLGQAEEGKGRGIRLTFIGSSGILVLGVAARTTYRPFFLGLKTAPGRNRTCILDLRSTGSIR